jgi:hypothetical protein
LDIAFPSTYEDSRERFMRDFESIRGNWLDSKLTSQPLKASPDVSIDYAWAEPKEKKNLIAISTALHGIEGFVGSVMLKIFMDEFASMLNFDTSGILLIHAINPVGMKNHRRYNENNVDLNRNFIWDEQFKAGTNQDYDLLDALLNPKQPVHSIWRSDIVFIGRLIKSLLGLSILRIRNGMLSGQYRHPGGVQFGGQQTEESTTIIRSLFTRALSDYDQVIHIDLHTGYGPRYQMSFVNSTREQASAEELKQRFNYPLIVSANPSEFYTVTGDITEYFYQLRDDKHPNKNIFATCFEFGTFGNSLPAQIRSMRITILENRLFHFGTDNEAVKKVVQNEYNELFFPAERKWREKAMQDCRQAMRGIFTDFGLIQ